MKNSDDNLSESMFQRGREFIDGETNTVSVTKNEWLCDVCFVLYNKN